MSFHWQIINFYVIRFAGTWWINSTLNTVVSTSLSYLGFARCTPVFIIWFGVEPIEPFVAPFPLFYSFPNDHLLDSRGKISWIRFLSNVFAFPLRLFHTLFMKSSCIIIEFHLTYSPFVVTLIDDLCLAWFRSVCLRQHMAKMVEDFVVPNHLAFA